MANEHIDHSTVSISSGVGLSGGGTIESTRTLALDIPGLVGEGAIVAADTLAFYDATAGAHRKVTLTELGVALVVGDEKVKVDAAATAGYLGVAAGDGVLRTSSLFTYTDGGDFVTLGIDESALTIANMSGAANYLLADGSVNLTGNLSVDAGITIDGRDLSVDGTKLDGIEDAADVTDATNVAAAGAAMSGGAFHDGFSDFVANEHIDWTGASVAFSTSSTITGVNVTSGSNPGHTHLGGVSGVDTVTELTNNGSMNGAPCHVVYSDGVDTFDFVDVSDEAKSNAIGLLAEAISMGNSGFVRVGGVLSKEAGWWIAVGAGAGGLTAGSFYYVSTVTPGWITDTKPTDLAYRVVRLGIALSTTDLAIDIQEAAPKLELLDTNATIYVATTGNDSTGTGLSGAPFATLQKALSSLADNVISPSVIATIQFSDGTYVRTTTDTVNHPDGGRIRIVGENTHSISMTSVQSSSGSAGAWSIVCNVSDTSNVAVDDFVMFPYNMSGGTRAVTMCGVWKVTVKSGSTITVASTHKYASAPSGAVAGTLTVLKTVLQYNGVGGIAVSTKLGLIDKLCLSGNGNGNGIAGGALSVTAGGTSLGISRFSLNVSAAAKSVFYLHDSCISSATNTGVRVLYGFVWMLRAVVSGATGRGIFNSSGHVDCQSAVISGNSVTAIDASWVGLIICYGAKCQYNTAIGVYSYAGSFIRAQTATVNNNGGANFNPAINTLGNVQSYTIQ